MSLRLELNGKSISVDVEKVTAEGVWLSIDGKPFLLDRERYPWFANATMDQVFNAEAIGTEGVSWEDLDVDLSIDSILHPEKYPLRAKH